MMKQVDITVRRANRKTGIDNIIELIKEVDPYSSFHSFFKKNSIRQIDYSASFKTKVSSDIQAAVESFKKSDLYNSRKKILKAINLLEKRKNISNDILYLYSWAYHILGNIAYVQSRYSWAETLYGASLSIKRQIIDLPPIVVIATKSKFIFSQSWRLSVPEWHNRLSDLKDELKRLKRVEKPDIEWFNNIFIDLNYQMARCKRLLGDIPSAMKVCKIALSHSLENDNQVGIVRGYILSGLLSTMDDYWVRKLDDFMDNEINPTKFLNPWVRIYLHAPLLNDLQITEPVYADKIVGVFIEHGVQPIPEEDIK